MLDALEQAIENDTEIHFDAIDSAGDLA